jgi:hypothetical protein
MELGDTQMLCTRSVEQGTAHRPPPTQRRRDSVFSSTRADYLGILKLSRGVATSGGGVIRNQ